MLHFYVDKFKNHWNPTKIKVPLDHGKSFFSGETRQSFPKTQFINSSTLVALDSPTQSEERCRGIVGHLPAANLWLVEVKKSCIVKMCQEQICLRKKHEKKNFDLVIIGVVHQHLDGICVK